MSDDGMQAMEARLMAAIRPLHEGQARLQQGQDGLEQGQARLAQAQASLDQRQATLEQGQASLRSEMARMRADIMDAVGRTEERVKAVQHEIGVSLSRSLNANERAHANAEAIAATDRSLAGLSHAFDEAMLLVHRLSTEMGQVREALAQLRRGGA
jgi:peptidoglycan hydrolase CwlO-like protein